LSRKDRGHDKASLEEMIATVSAIQEKIEDNQEGMEVTIRTDQEQMRAEIRRGQEEVKATINSIQSELEETIKHQVQDILPSVNQWT
jgi:hypothetical protein